MPLSPAPTNPFIANAEGYRQAFFALPRDMVDAFMNAWMQAGALSASVEEVAEWLGARPDLVDKINPVLAHLSPSSPLQSSPIFAEPRADGTINAPMEELWQNCVVSVLVERHAELETLYLEALAILAQEGVNASERLIHHEWVAAQNWVLASREQFQPVVLQKIAVVAPWHTPPADKLIVRIEPGMAFGSGAHATTRMMLEWLETQDWQGMRLCDYGCGSGILAIAAGLMGAQAIATDIDEAANQVAQDNLRVHELLPSQVRVCTINAAHEELIQNPVPVLVANILLQPLLNLEPIFRTLIAPQGTLMMTGILTEQVPLLHQAYHNHNYWQSFEEINRQENWSLVRVMRH